MTRPTPSFRRRCSTTSAYPAVMTFLLVLLLFLAGPSKYVAAFSTSPSALTTPARTVTVTTKKSSKYVSVACSLSGGATTAIASSDDTDSQIFRQAALVGTVTAAMGYVYGRVLDATVSGVWTKLPSLLAASSCFSCEKSAPR